MSSEQDTPKGTLTAAEPDDPTSQAVEEFKHRLHAKLIERLDFHHVNRLPEDRRRGELTTAIEHLIDAERLRLSPGERDWLTGELPDELLGLGPLEKLLRDATVNDILV